MIKRYSENNISSLFDLLEARSQLDVPEVTKIVAEIIAEVRSCGDTALYEYTAKFDKVEIENFRVSKDEIESAKIDENLLDIINKAIDNITDFHKKQKVTSWTEEKPGGIQLGLLSRPIESVGLYVPSGSAPLISTVLMNAIPAKVAGVKRIVMATPPGRDGKISQELLVAARLVGVDEIFKMGGAQAIAAMAFGTESVIKVDKIFGPGNIFVATAKRMVFGYCGIDSFAGPSEITIVADDTANAKFIAADMLSQAEHDKLASSILITTSDDIAEEVILELEVQLSRLNRKQTAEESLSKFGAIIRVDSLAEAIQIVNEIAPEHLELCVDKADELVGHVKNAGAIFLGNYSPEPLGDYFAGPNHVLPTSGTARFFSPLNVGDFVKKTSLISYSKDALEAVWKDVYQFAKAEELDAHANSIKVRFENLSEEK
ncbi:MAG: histidinol dehydrogenase [Bacillota bacterium]